MSAGSQSSLPLHHKASDQALESSDDSRNMDDSDFLNPSPQQPLLATPGRPKKLRNYSHPSGSVPDGQVQGLQGAENTAGSPQSAESDGRIVFQIAPRHGISFTLSAVAVNISLSILTVITQVGMTVTLPMYSTALESHLICGEQKAVGDVYFLLVFTAFWFVLFFGSFIGIARLLNPEFPLGCSVSHFNRALLGSFNTLNGILIVFSSPEDRTPVFLQPLLSTIIIPFTVFFSYVILRKTESYPRLICCLIVIVGLIISTEPVIFNIDGQGSSGSVHTKPIVRFVWSCVFMIGFIPLAINNVVEEKILKKSAKKAAEAVADGGSAGKDHDVNSLLLMFWINLWTFIMFVVMFWVDFIPVFGTVKGFHQFQEHMGDGMRCMFGSPRGPHDYYANVSMNCSATLRDPVQFNPDPHCSLPVTYCWLFIVFYCLANLFSLMLIKYAAGAVYLVVVQGLITPLGAIFWYLFQMDANAHLKWKPVYYKSASTYTLIGLFMMVPAVIAYNVIGLRAAKKKQEGGRIHEVQDDV
ncbi:uncharacterized protein LOC135814430 [Sycon ciliatum]|uniref:uncharacterized protein LOC135814430 n=1 Tax=Sycon ciliatum TaxID=27933 RepID=UPI0031F68632